MQYCSGDVHSGTITTPTDQTFGLYFAGHLIVAAVLDYLVAVGNLSKYASTYYDIMFVCLQIPVFECSVQHSVFLYS